MGLLILPVALISEELKARAREWRYERRQHVIDVPERVFGSET